MKILLFITIGLSILVVSGLWWLQKDSVKPNKNSFENSAGALLVSSPAFENGQPIPGKYSCNGKNIIPEINISNVPKEAKTLVLIVDDPDVPSGPWFHLLAWNIKPVNQVIEEGGIPAGAVLGKNSGGKIGFDGPCPPSGIHRYFIRVLALNESLSLALGSSFTDLEKAISGKVISQGVLFGTFAK